VCPVLGTFYFSSNIIGNESPLPNAAPPKNVFSQTAHNVQELGTFSKLGTFYHRHILTRMLGCSQKTQQQNSHNTTHIDGANKLAKKICWAVVKNQKHKHHTTLMVLTN
jgi:hypothetical protein